MSKLSLLATEDDLARMKVDLLQESLAMTKQTVSEAVDPLKDEMNDFRSRLDKLSSGSDVFVPGRLSKEQFHMLNSVDAETFKSKGALPPSRGQPLFFQNTLERMSSFVLVRTRWIGKILKALVSGKASGPDSLPSTP